MCRGHVEDSAVFKDLERARMLAERALVLGGKERNSRKRTGAVGTGVSASCSRLRKSSQPGCASWCFAPALHQGVRNIQLIEDARDDKVDQCGDRIRMVIEAGVGRQDHSAGTREAQYVLKMDGRERRLARHQHQLAVLP